MKKIILILITIIFCACSQVNTPKESTSFIIKPGYNPLTLVTVDSCEYLLGEWGNATVLTHKGNCKFCTERSKK